MVSLKLPSSGKALADLAIHSTVNKARKPRFELHLKIYDLNNVPLVSGVSHVKWHLPHSIHGEHRGRTAKCPILNHRVEYDYSKIVPLRIAIDRNNNLSDCPIEFEVIQEFESGSAGRSEKVVLGKIHLNLSEYVLESEALLRDVRPGTADSTLSSLSARAGSSSGVFGHSRKRSSLSGTGISTTTATTTDSASTTAEDDAGLGGTGEVQDGVVRRYLMQESKVNSTLKISILMVQVDGERNFVAPALKTAPMFGGIAGIMAGEQGVGVAAGVGAAEADDLTGPLPSLLSKTRDASEVQDMYRRALTASWACQPGEMPADECIEDIFSGGDGFRDVAGAPRTNTVASSASSTTTASTTNTTHNDGGTQHHPRSFFRSGVTSSSPLREDGSSSDDVFEMGATLRPHDVRQFQQQQQQHQQKRPARGVLHRRQHSGNSERNLGIGRGAGGDGGSPTRSIASGGSSTARRPKGFQLSPQHLATADRDVPPAPTLGRGGGLMLGPLLSHRSQSATSMASMATTAAGSTLLADSGGGGGGGGSGDRTPPPARAGFKSAREVDEFDVRDDLIAWRLPGTTATW